MRCTMANGCRVDALQWPHARSKACGTAAEPNRSATDRTALWHSTAGGASLSTRPGALRRALCERWNGARQTVAEQKRQCVSGERLRKLAVITTSRSAGAAGGGGPSGGVQGGAERLSSSSDWQMRLRIGGGVTSNVENICDSHAQHAAMRSMHPCTMQLRHAWRLPLTVPQNRRHGDWWARIAQPWQQVGTNRAAAAASPGGILLGGPESAPAASA